MATELYTLSDISKIFGIKKKRLSDWLVRGFIKPSAKSKGQSKPSWFTRGDIYLIRLLEDMIDHGIDRAEAAKYIEGIREKLSLEGFLSESDSIHEPPLDLWAAVSVARGHQPGFSLKRDMMSIGDLRDWRPPENPEIIGVWETQHDFVMLFNLYTLIREVNKACDEYGSTV
jgi:DNA-binding transcriptional MerR regulator